MKYNFDEIVNRRGTNCVKWDEAESNDMIPLWVADMDFRTYPAITEALVRRAEHGVFGYTFVPESYYQSVINWFLKRHNWPDIRRSDILYVPGVVPAISAIIRGLTLPGDKVLVQTPVYNCFFSSIRNQGCEVEENLLRYENHTYAIDWDDFEAKCADPRVRIFLLCNPHNPAGRVWTRDELVRMGEICLRHHVFVIADEIHCEFVMPGYRYTPFASISEAFLMNCAVCVAPSKAFNIAGLQISNIIVRSEAIRERINRAINIHEVCDVNPFGVIATEVAYTEGGAEWLRQLNDYIAENYQYLVNFFAENLPQFPVVTLQGTYLAWVDCSVLNKPAHEITTFLYQQEKVWINDGKMYGDPTNRFVRINLASPRAILAEGLRRIAKGLCRL